MVEFARTHGIATGIFGARHVIGHRLHFQNVQAAKFGNLRERTSAVLSTSHAAVACGIRGTSPFWAMSDSPINRAAPYRSGLNMAARLGQSRPYGKHHSSENSAFLCRKGLTALIAHLTLRIAKGLRRPSKT
jgi:hypothetical protein